MADLKYYDVILKPVVTEKSMNSMAEKKYVFYVNPDATKTQIAEAVEKMFAGTKVAKVNTMNVSGNPIVKNNTAQQGNNIYLRAEHPTALLGRGERVGARGAERRTHLLHAVGLH